MAPSVRHLAQRTDMVNPTSKYRGKCVFSQGLREETAYSGGKEETQDVAEAVRPCLFGVHGSLGLCVGEIDAELPSAFNEKALEHVRISQMLQAFRCSHVQPDAQVWPSGLAFDRVENAAMIPPKGGRHDGDSAEDLGVGEAEVERDESAER